MAYQVIEQIKVGTNPQGKAWGGFIYSANMSVGYSSATTQLILNIMSPTNDYTISDSDLKVNTAPTLIKVGDLGINMFLYAYTKNRTADGGTVLNVTYVDQSVNLDRVYIGLANEHTRKNIKSIVLAGSVPMTCEACDGSVTPRTTTATVYRQVDSYGLNANVGELTLGSYGAKQSVFHYGQGGSAVPLLIITVNGASALMTDTTGSNLVAPTAPTISGFDIIASLTTTRVISYYGWGANYTNVANPAFQFGSIQEGGLIALGTEEFSQSTCSSGAVTYSLKELKNAIKDFGFLIETVPGTSTETIPDGYDDLRRNYSGTLRSVLQNWGNDYGFDFSYDFTSNKIIGINLRQAITDIETIKDRIKNSDSLTNYAGSPVVETLEESASLAGTYRKYHSTIYRKDARVRNYSKTIYNQARFSPLRLQDIMPLPSSFETGKYLSYDDFYTSCVLSTISKNLWFYYNVKQLNTFNAADVAADSRLRANILKRVGRIFGDSNADEILIKKIPTGKASDFIDKIFNAQKALGERFINQYYVNFQFTPHRNKYCAGDYLDVDFKAEFSDNVETFYKANGIFPNSVPEYAKLVNEVYSVYPVSTLVANYLGYYGSLTVNCANFLTRQGAYNYSYNQNGGLNVFNSNFFKFSKLNVNTEEIRGNPDDIIEYFAIKSDKITVSFITDRANPREYQAIAVPSSNNACRLHCEQDFVSEICDFNRCLGVGQRSDQEWPKGLIPNNNAVYGDTIRVVFNAATDSITPSSQTFEITTPSYAPYQSNFIYQFNNRYVMPGAKKVLAGEIDATAPSNSDYPQNVEAVDFSTADVTSDIDTFFDSTNNQVVTNVLMPNNGLMTVENYDTELRNTALATASVSNLRKTFRFSVPGMLNSSFSDILTPAKGLLGFDINFDDKGLTTTYNYATRPPKPPQKEMVFNRISPSFARR